MTLIMSETSCFEEKKLIDVVGQRRREWSRFLLKELSRDEQQYSSAFSLKSIGEVSKSKDELVLNR